MKNQRNIVVGVLIAIVVIGVIIFNLNSKNRIQSPYQSGQQGQNVTGTKPGGPSTGTNVRGNTGPDYTPKTSTSPTQTAPTAGTAQQPTDPALKAYTWMYGNFMDYPKGTTVTSATSGGKDGPTYSLPTSIFAGSDITSAKVVATMDCENQVPRTSLKINGKPFYVSTSGLLYQTKLSSLCIQTLSLNFTPKSPNSSTDAYKNLKAIFAYMVTTYAKKH